MLDATAQCSDDGGDPDFDSQGRDSQNCDGAPEEDDDEEYTPAGAAAPRLARPRLRAFDPTLVHDTDRFLHL